MKHKKETIDETMPVAFETSLEGHPFTITGDYITVAPLYEAALAAQPTVTPEAIIRTRRVAEKVGSVVLAPAMSLMERTQTDASTFVYDMFNGTHFLSAVKQKRQLEKDLRMAQNLGLLGDDVCAKHRKALKDVKTVR